MDVEVSMRLWKYTYQTLDLIWGINRVPGAFLEKVILQLRSQTKQQFAKKVGTYTKSRPDSRKLLGWRSHSTVSIRSVEEHRLYSRGAGVS
jgi:hypothetical protein